MIACVRIPYFAAAVEGQARPELLSRPLLVARTGSGRAKVVATDALARREGAEAGMLLSRARALVPAAVILPAASDRWRRALRGLMEKLSIYSSYVDAERDCAQTALLYLDLGKLRPSDGLALGQQIRALLLKGGFSGSIGLATGKVTAGVAASLTTTIQLVPRGEEAAFLAPHPVGLLGLEKETARRLALLGLERIGQLAAFPRGALAAQFGAEGARLARLSLGRDHRHVAKFVPERYERRQERFEPPLDDGQILERVLVRLVTEVSSALIAQGLTPRELTLTLQFEDGGSAEKTHRLREATSSTPALTRVTRSLLEKLEKRGRVTAVEVGAGRLNPVQPRQLSLFGEEDRQNLVPKLVEVAARYGDDRLYRLALTEPLLPLPELAFRLERVDVG